MGSTVLVNVLEVMVVEDDHALLDIQLPAITCVHLLVEVVGTGQGGAVVSGCLGGVVHMADYHRA